jgi:uncharacterized protein
MTTKRFLPVLFLFAVQATCAASFDCSKQLTRIERMICDDPEISFMDDALSLIYGKLVTEQSGIKRDQVRWIRERNLCTNASCVSDAYRRQLAAVAEQIPSAEHRTQSSSPLGFSGKWELDFRGSPDLECGFAVFSLRQYDHWISGTHDMATIGCGRLNEDGAVVGVSDGADAILIVTSGRNGAIVVGKAQRREKRLLWKAQSSLSRGAPDGDDLILKSGKLIRSGQ